MSDEDTALVVTGSQDKSILVHSIDPTVSEPVATYIGHKDLVSCLIYQDSCVISGSWDSTIRVWDAPCIVLKAHEPAVWTLAGLHDFDGTNRILSGGADKMIKLWDISTSSCIQEYRGHGDVVRDVKVLSAEVFISASNDCTICRWNIHTGQRLNELYGHQAFVYNLSLMCTGNGFVSCGEDSTMKVWKDTECVQTISLPCISVWCVGCSSSGDIVVGSSDSVARVFTMDPSRIASPQHIQTFLSNVEEFQNSRNKKSIDVSSLPKMSVALSEPGQKTGDTKLVNNNGKAEVYQVSTFNKNTLLYYIL
jgi:phospholipase A-2-activating protein